MQFCFIAQFNRKEISFQYTMVKMAGKRRDPPWWWCDEVDGATVGDEETTTTSLQFTLA